MRGDVQITNPSQKWFSWSGSTGKLSYYDKENKENVEVETPFTFLLLDTFTTIKGYNEDAKQGIFSNEVRNTTEQILTVRCGKELVSKGLYKDIKADVIAAGGGYAQSCYIAYKEESGELAIGNITMTGSSFSGGTHKPSDKNMKDVEVGGWLAFTKNNAANLYKKGIVIQGKDERVCTNGAVKFYAPSFKLVEVTPETDAKAIELTQTLKAFMTEYFKKTQGQAQEEQVAKKVETAHQENFGNTTEAYTDMEKTFLGVKDNAPETPFEIDSSDLPF
jgi:hypothetical protein